MGGEFDALPARLQAAEAHAASLREEFSRFGSRLAHDLQAVLRNIDGFAEALQATDGLTEKQERYLGRIRASATRGEGILRDLSALSNVRMAELHPSATDLGALVKQTIYELPATLDARRIAWDLDGIGAARVTADPGLLRLAMQQLLGNAAKFTRNCAAPRVRVAVQATAAVCEIIIADNGAGFDPQYAGRLFQPFERLHSPSEFEGNGIGLALVHIIAARHGGSVRAQGRPGEGAQVVLSLPNTAATTAPAPPAPQPAAPQGHLPQGAPASGLRILLVDDDALVLATLRAMLERDGHEVVTACGGPAGLRALEEHVRADLPPDVLVSDWLMPEVGGPRLAQAARQMCPATRVVMLTGQRPAADGSHPLPKGVDLVIGKPVRAAELRQALRVLRGERTG